MPEIPPREAALARFLEARAHRALQTGLSMSSRPDSSTPASTHGSPEMAEVCFEGKRYDFAENIGENELAVR
jgi:hypothetical protein